MVPAKLAIVEKPRTNPASRPELPTSLVNHRTAVGDTVPRSTVGPLNNMKAAARDPHFSSSSRLLTNSQTGSAKNGTRHNQTPAAARLIPTACLLLGPVEI